jgi:hypothetical protein
MITRGCTLALFSFAVSMALGTPARGAMPGEELVIDQAKIQGPFLDDVGGLERYDEFGGSVTSLGDLDGDGIGDLAAGAPGDDAWQTEAGAIWILFPNQDGSLKRHQRITRDEGGFWGYVDRDDQLGSALTFLGDLDGDGVGDLAVGAPGDDDGGSSAGAVWILFLRTDGTVKAHAKISPILGGFGGTLQAGDYFGSSLATLEDLDGDGIAELAVGATGDDDGTTGSGAVWILFLNSNGTVKSHQKISSTLGGFGGVLDSYDEFGGSLTAVDDLDGDGIDELVVGASGDDDGGSRCGAVWVLFLNSSGAVRSHQKISATHGGFGGGIVSGHQFGSSVASPGDLDGDGVGDLVVGAPFDRSAFTGGGGIWILFLQTTGTVKAHQRITGDEGGFGGFLYFEDDFGCSLSPLGDFNGDGIADLAVGAKGDADGGNSRGAVWILSLDSTGTCVAEDKFGGFSFWTDESRFGTSVAEAGDIDGNGICDLLSGVPRARGQGVERGGVWTLFLETDGMPSAQHRFGDGEGGFTGVLADYDHFGSSVTRLDGFADLAVGAPGDDDGGSGRGAVWMLRCDPTWSVEAQWKISALSGGLLGSLDDEDRFGTSLGRLADLDGDGVDELVVGAPGDDDGSAGAGAVWILFHDAAGVIVREQKISASSGGFGGILGAGDTFGGAVAGIGDLDGDGLEELVVGAPGDDGEGSDRGALWILHLDTAGAVVAEEKIASGTGGFDGDLHDFDRFGSAITSAGDVNGDGYEDLLVGAPGDDTGGVDRGAAWLLGLDPGGSVRGEWRIAHGEGGFPGGSLGLLADGDEMGSSLCSLVDIDGNGTRELVAGAPRDDFGSEDLGAVYVIFTHSVGYASALERNGSAVNPAIFSSIAPPCLGSDWAAEVDTAAVGAGGFVFTFVYSQGHPGIPMPFGELLLDPASSWLATDWTVAYGGVSHHEIPVPSDLVFSGLTASAQAYVNGVPPSGQLTNAIDLTFGF